MLQLKKMVRNFIYTVDVAQILSFCRLDV